MKKRIHVPVAKPGQLLARWGRVEPGEPPSVVYAYGAAGACKADSRVLMEALEGARVFENRSLVQELEARGYDITTLRFSIEIKMPPAA